MSRKRRTFDAAFKLQVARMVRDQGMNVGQVCRDMKLESMVRRWVAQLEAEPLGEAGPGKPLTAEQPNLREPASERDAAGTRRQRRAASGPHPDARPWIRPVWKRKFLHTTNSRHDLPIAENVLAREFEPAAVNTAWVSDITYFRTHSGWLYLAVVMDLFSRKIVGWAMAPNMPAELVYSALQMAIAQRQPPPGLVVHSDRGSQVRERCPSRLADSTWARRQHEPQG